MALVTLRTDDSSKRVSFAWRNKGAPVVNCSPTSPRLLETWTRAYHREGPDALSKVHFPDCDWSSRRYLLIMKQAMRHDHILERLRTGGSVQVSEISEELGISEVTIRRDLVHLAEVGALRRVRGGAVSMRMQRERLPASFREIDFSVIEDRIAAAAAGLILDGETVALGSGTTCIRVARALVQRRLTLMPFSVQAALELLGQPGIHLVTPGGAVQPEEGSILGAACRSIVGGFSDLTQRSSRFVEPCRGTALPLMTPRMQRSNAQ
ncbi:DeoR/GlpR family DNA-binding transcription regulator [Paenarthrobacter sp. NPDC092416]|uniref:DeoR/GlpR family DNA-binding transcription regulator n=1 Tax=Paenarthrobacter sp. NPDC092416 TaxID=3364386 RepID=UPI00382FDDF6